MLNTMTNSTLPDIETRVVELGISPEYFTPYGRDKGKVSLKALGKSGKTPGKLILVSAITPTPAGEGKTTISIGLAQGLKYIGKKSALALREPSLGPVFGRKGGATGGGKSSLTPPDSINLHFTGDFHAITSAHNLLTAVIENRVFYKNTRLDPQKITWKRVMDMNDRGLRAMINGLNKQGVPRETSFDITPASEIMAVLCMATSQQDLRERLNRMIVGYTADDEPVYAEEMNVTGALMALLKDAMNPNIVQSLEGVPAFVHGGPFANIAHGCNSIIATKMAMEYADYAVTEAGFAFDLGAEKFLDIKCRAAGFAPSAIVIVATVRALKMHGGVPLAELKDVNVEALKKGMENLAAHLDAAAQYKRPVVVAINRFYDDADEEVQVIHDFCAARGVRCATADIFADGGEGGARLAELVVEAADESSPAYEPLYPLDIPAADKIAAIATKIYGADKVEIAPAARKKLAQIDAHGHGNLPICMAKTQNSLSDNAKLLGRPRGFTVTVRDVELANGAGYIVPLTGTILRMPALPKVPAAEAIDLDDDGNITGM